MKIHTNSNYLTQNIPSPDGNNAGGEGTPTGTNPGGNDTDAIKGGVD